MHGWKENGFRSLDFRSDLWDGSKASFMSFYFNQSLYNLNARRNFLIQTLTIRKDNEDNIKIDLNWQVRK